MSEKSEKLPFRAAEVTETRLCHHGDMHLGYEFTAPLFTGEAIRWAVDRLDTEFKTGSAVSPDTKLIRLLRLRDGVWYDSHSTVNQAALSKIKFH